MDTAISGYFHADRSVSGGSPQQGDFAVDHRDAECALALAKIVLAYTAKLLVHTPAV